MDALTQRTIQVAGFPVVITEFHFHDPDGDVNFLARELVATNGPNGSARGAPITFPPDLQRRGAVFAGRWACDANVYRADMRAYLVDAAGNRSDVVAYSVHCNGG